jgi:hypothetical protein
MMWGKHPFIRAILAEGAFKALSQDGVKPDLQEVVQKLATLYERIRQRDQAIDILERFCQKLNLDSISTESISSVLESQANVSITNTLLELDFG